MRLLPVLTSCAGIRSRKGIAPTWSHFSPDSPLKQLPIVTTDTTYSANANDRQRSTSLSESNLIPPTLVEIDGQPVNVRNLSHAVTSIIARLSHPGSFLVCTLNLDHLVKLRKSGQLRQAYARAEIITPDGFPIVKLGDLRGCRLERTTGADLIEPLCAIATQRRLP